MTIHVRLFAGAWLLALGLGACDATRTWDSLAGTSSRLTTPEANLRSAGGRYATSDNFLGVLGIANPSSRVLEALQPIPANRALLFVGPDGDRTVQLTEATLRYLAWPRQFQAVHDYTKSGMQMAVAQLRQPVAGVLYFRRPDRPVRSPARCKLTSVAIGPELVLQYAVDTEDVDWKSRCFS